MAGPWPPDAHPPQMPALMWAPTSWAGGAAQSRSQAPWQAPSQRGPWSWPFSHKFESKRPCSLEVPRRRVPGGSDSLACGGADLKHGPRRGGHGEALDRLASGAATSGPVAAAGNTPFVLTILNALSAFVYLSFSLAAAETHEAHGLWGKGRLFSMSHLRVHAT